MGRKVQLRPSYNNDAKFLLRLVEAVEKDGRIALEWKRKICGNLRAVAMSFIEIDKERA